MRVTMVSGSGTAIAGSRLAPFVTEVFAGQVLVGLIAVPILVPVAGLTYLVLMRNTSAGGQNIRFGGAPSFIGLTGFLLAPNDVVTLDFWGPIVNAIADAAGGTLEVGIWST